MLSRALTAAAFGSILTAHDATAGCGLNFQFAIVDSSAQVIEVLPTGEFQDWDEQYAVVVTPGRFFRASVWFNSCFGSSMKLWRDGVLIQEWVSSYASWTTDEPGVYEWWMEGYGNMAPPPITRVFQISSGSVTGLGPELGGEDLIIRSLVRGDDVANVYLDCHSEQTTDLHVLIVSLDGRVLNASLHPIIQGENRVQITLHCPARLLVLVRLLTTNGTVRTRKVLL